MKKILILAAVFGAIVLASDPAQACGRRKSSCASTQAACGAAAEAKPRTGLFGRRCCNQSQPAEARQQYFAPAPIRGVVRQYFDGLYLPSGNCGSGGCSTGGCAK